MKRLIDHFNMYLDLDLYLKMHIIHVIYFSQPQRR